MISEPADEQPPPRPRRDDATTLWRRALAWQDARGPFDEDDNNYGGGVENLVDTHQKPIIHRNSESAQAAVNSRGNDRPAQNTFDPAITAQGEEQQNQNTHAS